MSNYLIYKHTTPSNKVYIGITRQTLESRFGKNGYRYERCTAFYRAIQKYGWDRIRHEVIDTADSLDEANDKEIMYIKLYNSHNPDFGYNCTIGGDGVSGWKANDEQKHRNSEAKKRMWENEDIRTALIEERRQRVKNPEYIAKLKERGKKVWENKEYKKRMSIHLREIAKDPERIKMHSEYMKKLWASGHFDNVERHPPSGKDHANSKQIYCVTNKKFYDTARSAEKDVDVSYKDISRCLRMTSKGSHTTARGLSFLYSIDNCIRIQSPRDENGNRIIQSDKPSKYDIRHDKDGYVIMHRAKPIKLYK